MRNFSENPSHPESGAVSVYSSTLRESSQWLGNGAVGQFYVFGTDLSICGELKGWERGSGCMGNFLRDKRVVRNWVRF